MTGHLQCTREKLVFLMVSFALVSFMCMFYVSVNPTRTVLVQKRTVPFFNLLSDKPLNRSSEICHATFKETDGNMCSFCSPRGNRSRHLTVFVEDFQQLQGYYGNYEEFYRKVPKECALPHNHKCLLLKSHEKADVVFRMTKYVSYFRPVRYCYPQIFALLHSEAEYPGYDKGFWNQADVTISHHLESTVLYHDICISKYVNLAQAKSAPRVAAKRKGIALFVSNCDSQWRQSYLSQLLSYVEVDSFGGCFHNSETRVRKPSGPQGWRKVVIETAKRYRMVISFENTIQRDYISEKLFQVYQSGAVPVYWGPPEIYKWIPGNHTFIDASKFGGPQELAEYLEKVNTDDKLYQHHTTNFDWEKTDDMVSRHCSPLNYMCGVCRAGYRMREESISAAHDASCSCDYSVHD